MRRLRRTLASSATVAIIAGSIVIASPAAASEPEPAGPGVSITSPENGVWVPANSVFVIDWELHGEAVWSLFEADGVEVYLEETPFPATGMQGIPTTDWEHGSTHVVTYTAQNALGGRSTATLTVVADARGPELTIVQDSGLSWGGSVNDEGSGVDRLEAYIYDLVGGSCISGDEVPISVSSGTWSIALPAGTDSAEYCLEIIAYDKTGLYTIETARHLPELQAPSGLVPTGAIVEPPTSLAWSSTPRADSYEYRLAPAGDDLDDADIVAATSTSVTMPGDQEGSWHWQVRAVASDDERGPWSAAATFDIIPAPALRCTVCAVAGSTVAIEWDGVAAATGYEIQIVGPARGGAPATHTETVGLVEDAVVALPSTFPTGIISVRIRALLEGERTSRWSGEERMMRFGAAADPTLLAPIGGSRVSGANVVVSWVDDPAVLAWDVRLSTSADVDADGGLSGDDASTRDLIDPMLLWLILVGAGDFDEVDPGVDPTAVDAELTCDGLAELLDEVDVNVDESDVACGDGSAALPTPLEDGTYYWQVRAFDVDAVLASETPPWSAVGSFVVGVAPVVTPPGPPASPAAPTAPATSTGPGAPPAPSSSTPSAGVEPVGVEAPEVDDDARDSASPSDGGADTSGGSGPESADALASEEGFTLWWVVILTAVVVVLGGAAALLRVLRRS